MVQPRILLDGEQFSYGWRLSSLGDVDGRLSFHPDDLPMVRAHYQGTIDDMQATALQQIIGADIYRYIVYILKFLELMSAQLGITKLTDAVILSHEAGSNPLKQQELAATWAEKSGAWLNVVGVAEREASKAKKAIAATNSDVEMRAIVDAFPSVLSEALQ